MSAYPGIVKLIGGEKRATDAGQVSMFAQINQQVAIDIPKTPEFDEELKLKLEKEVVGIYLSGHPLMSYSELFEQFSFNTGKIRVETEDSDQPDAGETETEFGNESRVTFGAIISEVKKILTKANKREMGILRVEDLYGSVKLMLFPAVYDRVKNIAVKDAVVKIVGKLSIREGENPIILADDIAPLADNPAARAAPAAVTPAAGAVDRRLYLKYNTKDEHLHAEVQNILRAYGGIIPVTVRCTATGNAINLPTNGRECSAVKFELECQIGLDNLMFK
jgi:DNA polymerase-3 subunit alpha